MSSADKIAKKPREVTGYVVSCKMQKTAVVSVERAWRHPLYGKVLRKKRLEKVHDADSVAKVGDLVVAVECAPISKTKHMVLKTVLKSTE